MPRPISTVGGAPPTRPSPISGTGASSTGGRGSGTQARKAGSSGPKPGGLGANASKLTVKGARITQSQIHIANMILGVGFGLKAGTIPLEAAIFAAIMETELGNIPADSGGYWGVFSAQASFYSRYGAWNSDAVTQAEAQGFFRGVSQGGFQAGGAIKASATYTDPAELAARVEAPYDSSHPPPFGQYIGEVVGSLTGVAAVNAVRSEAKAIVAAAGGGSIQATGAAGVVQPYYFEVNPGETYWHAMVRLAGEVNWPIFWDGPDLFFDEEQSLIANQVVRRIHRWDNDVISWNGPWDVRQIMTQMTLVMIDEMFEGLRVGDVVQLIGFGPASTGSAASPKKLPGRWLVQDLSRNKDEFFTTYTLVQPDLPKLEPAPQVKATGKAANSSSPSAYPGTPDSRGVVNPIPKFTITTWDMGLDVSGPSDGAPIYAPADCHVVSYVPDFYNGQPLVLYMFDKPLPGAPCQYMYVSETFTPDSTTVGTTYKRGQVVGRYRTGFSNNVEIGWGSPTASSRRLAQEKGWPDQHFSTRPPGSPWGSSFQDYFGIPGGKPPGFTG